MEKVKIITICGSLNFMEEIKFNTEKLALAGNCVLSIIYPTKNKNDYKPDELELLGLLHKQKIDMSDAIFVVNVGGYIGSSTQSEIEYAKQNNKEIIYLES